MRQEIKMTSPLSLLSNPVTCPERISIDNPQDVMAECKKDYIINVQKL